MIRLAQFLNEFNETTRYKLVKVNERITRLERSLDHLEFGIRRAATTISSTSSSQYQQQQLEQIEQQQPQQHAVNPLRRLESEEDEEEEEGEERSTTIKY